MKDLKKESKTKSNFDKLLDHLGLIGFDLSHDNIDKILEEHEIYKSKTSNSLNNFKAQINKNFLSRELINRLYLEFGIDRSLFLGKEESTDRKHLSKTYLERIAEQPYSIKKYCNLVDLIELPSSNGSSFKSEYFDKLKKYILEAKDEISVWEHLGLGNLLNSSRDLNKYFEANSEIFKLIEQKLGISEKENNGKKIETIQRIKKYKRVLALSLNNSLFHKIDESKYRELAIIECSITTFHHICSTLKNKEIVDASFYVNSFKRLVHYCVIDKTYIIVETYKNAKKSLQPNLLFIYRVSEKSKMKILYEQYFNEINTNLDHSLKIDEDNIVDKFESAEEYISEEIKKRKELIDEIKGLSKSKPKSDQVVFNSLIENLNNQKLKMIGYATILLSKKKVLEQYFALSPKK